MQNILVSIKDGSRILGISVRTVHRYLDLGIFHSVPVGRRRLLRADSLLKFAEDGLSLEKLRKVKASIEQGADEK
jgi:DNA-binding transcriptional MerR regulator